MAPRCFFCDTLLYAARWPWGSRGDRRGDRHRRARGAPATSAAAMRRQQRTVLGLRRVDGLRRECSAGRTSAAAAVLGAPPSGVQSGTGGSPKYAAVMPPLCRSYALLPPVA
eukprot:gene13937-biopygen21604